MERGSRKTLRGVVVSDKMDKTITVLVSTYVTDCHNLLKLSGDSAKSITVSATMAFNEETTRNYTFRAEIPFRENSTTTAPNYGTVSYANNIYKVAFEFETPSNQTYFLVFTFRELGQD